MPSESKRSFFTTDSPDEELTIAVSTFSIRSIVYFTGFVKRRPPGCFRCKYAVFVICCKCRFGGKGVDPKRKAALCPHWFCMFTPE